jgi:6-pyruvoyltetrahydropterin/6-carboxytetrahydropterin synthase
MSAPFEITKRFTFDAAHDLPQMPEGHKCKRHHGHTYEVELTLSAVELLEEGFVQDFGEIAQAAKSYIDGVLDHRDLSLIFGGENTTAERLAVMLFFIFQPKLPQLSSVTVRETPNTSATFTIGYSLLTFAEVQQRQKVGVRGFWLERAGISEEDFAGFPQ